MKHVVVWERVDTIGLEYARIDLDRLHLEGDVILVESGQAFNVAYEVECDDSGATRSAFIRVKLAATERECRITRDVDGEWTVNGRTMLHLRGIADIDLSITPATNIPPIRRLSLRPGAAAEVTAAWLRFPELEVVSLRQTYRRIASGTYDYHALNPNFSSILECDDNGIVRTYHGLWRAAFVGSSLS